MSIDPDTLEKIKKACSPQKAIYEIAGFVSTDILPDVENATNTANAASGQADSAYNRATEALNSVSRMEQQVEDSVIDLSDRVNGSTVTIIGSKNSGTSAEVRLPVSSRLQAGVMNSATYATLDELGNRVTALESNTVTYLVTLPNDNPTQAEINSAYQTAYPTAPFPPNDGTTVIDQGKQLFYRYVKNGNLWIKTSGFTISRWTNDTLGTVKGSTTPGQIQAETDGTGSLVGYDAIISNISTAKNDIIVLDESVINTELSVTRLTTQVDANTEGIAYNRARVIGSLHAAGGSTNGVMLSVRNPADALVSDVMIPVVNSATSGVITPAMYKQWNSIQGSKEYVIETFTHYVDSGVADFTITLLKRDGAIDGVLGVLQLYRVSGNNTPGAKFYYTSGSGQTVPTYIDITKKFGTPFTTNEINFGTSELENSVSASPGSYLQLADSSDTIERNLTKIELCTPAYTDVNSKNLMDPIIIWLECRMDQTTARVYTKITVKYPRGEYSFIKQ